MTTEAKIATPLSIAIMLHVATTCEEIPHQDCEAQIDVIAELHETGLIQTCNANLRRSGYEATDLGQAWVQMICSTPLPVFADPRNGSVIE